MKLKNILTTAGFIASFALISCSDKKDNSTASSTAKSEKVELKKFLLKEEPTNAVDIFDLRKTGTPGTPVTFTGKVMGADKVLIDGRAVMIVGDPKKLTSCDLRPGDNCQIPWDVCCDEPEDIKASIITVQVLDSAGKPIKEGLKGLAGIKELKHITINGIVDKVSTKDNMVVNATGIYVQQ